ncbi:MAG: type II secretion system minor pseudopilin GspK [Gammaproteobacteria bacterium]|nr:type II secretion system minor pseudopilin GspK [Gammaproteobacteria bacterium]MCW5583400.1 type II secretion system minor pseudopilin GspK [Gammaproteobacteria bacterium]
MKQIVGTPAKSLLRTSSTPRQQKGVVIVVALFFVAIVAVMAYFMMSRLERDIRRTSLLLRDTQAEFYAQGSIAWAMEQLRDNLAKQKPNVPVDVMPIRSPENRVNGYKISSTITDMQARVNLNNLVNKESQTDLKQLLHIVAPKISEQEAQEIVLAVTDWVTPGQQQNAYNKYYLHLTPPYRAAHRPMASASELQLVKGMTPKLFLALQPYITALPVQTLVNIQTAPAPVIAALSPNMTLETGKAIEKLRSQVTISSTQVFLNLDLVKNHNIPAEKITALSNYFLVETIVEIEKQHIVLYTLLERAASDGKGAINIIWQSKSVPG